LLHAKWSTIICVTTHLAQLIRSKPPEADNALEEIKNYRDYPPELCCAILSCTAAKISMGWNTSVARHAETADSADAARCTMTPTGTNDQPPRGSVGDYVLRELLSPSCRLIQYSRKPIFNSYVCGAEVRVYDNDDRQLPNKLVSDAFDSPLTPRNAVVPVQQRTKL